MFVRIVHHWCNPGFLEKGRAHIDSVGETAARAQGFRFRYRMEDPKMPELVTTLTVWDDESAFAAFAEAQERVPSNARAGADFFARTQHQVFVVAATTGVPLGAPGSGPAYWLNT